jgi:nucleoside-triphosphatase
MAGRRFEQFFQGSHLVNDMALWIVTGERGAGKTAFCARLIELARSAGQQVAGVLSPAVFEGGEKIAIDVIDLRTNERRRLADHFTPVTTIQPFTLKPPSPAARVLCRRGRRLEQLLHPAHHGPHTPRWSFHAEAVAWGDAAFSAASPCDLLVVDELGPLEFERGEGWQAGLTAIEARDYRWGVVVIRPELLGAALQRWPSARVIEISNTERAVCEAEQVGKKFVRI